LGLYGDLLHFHNLLRAFDPAVVLVLFHVLIFGSQNSTTSLEGTLSMPGLGGHREELNGFPAIFNIEQDPREEANVLATSGWVIAQYLRLIGEYEKSLEKYPNPKAVNLTDFGK